jgi:acid phosphatase
MSLAWCRARRSRVALLAITLLVACQSNATPSPTLDPTVSLSPTATRRPTPTGSPSPSPTPAFDHPTHVFVVVLENTGAEQAIGPKAPYLAGLAARYGLATNYFGVGHPSQPNYLELFSGSTQGVTDDKKHDITAPTLADQLEAAGFSWRLYAENYPGNCDTHATASGGADGPGDYARKHNPAISFTSISGDPARCANITDFSHLDPNASDVAFIIPNLCHDMHDCPIATGDAWARDVLGPIIDSPAMEDGVMFITFDEAEVDPNRVTTIVVSPRLMEPVTSAHRYDHASLLRTIEDLYRLPCLADACHAEPMTDLVPPT